MSILRVANVQFNASGTSRIDYDVANDDGVVRVIGNALKIPTGSTATRPTSNTGLIRYNDQTGYLEFANVLTGWSTVATNVAYEAANAAFNFANSAYASGNASYAFTNSAYASINSNWTVTNTVYGVANAAFASANNVAPQVTPAFNTANAAFAAANNINLASAYITINAAYGTSNGAYTKANSALANVSGTTFGGEFTISGNTTVNKKVIVNYTPATADNAAIFVASANTQGGAGYADFLKVQNVSYPGVTNPYKSFRLNQSGGIEIINSAYTATLLSLDDSGNFNVSGNLSGNFPTIFQSSQNATTSTDRTLNGDSGWVTHLSVTFTTTRTGPIFCSIILAESYENGNMWGAGQFVLSGPTNLTSQTMSVANQFTANHAGGSHSMNWIFPNCAVGSYTLNWQARNFNSGTTWILNNYNGSDTLFCNYI